MRQRIVAGLDIAHTTFFGHPLTDSIKIFLSNLSWSFAGGIFSSFVLLIVNILAGRVLGPEEYGKYNVVWTIAQIVTVFAIFGMDSSNLRSTENANEKKDSIASLVLFITFSSVIVSIFYFLTVNLINFSNTSKNTLLLALFLGIALSSRQIFDSFLRLTNKFKSQTIVKIIESMVVLGIFLLFIYVGKFQYRYELYVASLIIGSILAVFLYFLATKKDFGNYNYSLLKNRFSYAKILFIGSVLGTIFSSMDKLLIAKNLSFHDVGLYSAYYTASFAIAAQFMVFFDNVFFPTVAKYKDDFASIIRKIDRLSIFGFLPMYIIFSIFIYLMMFFFGKSYETNFYYIFIFALLAVLKMILSINSSLVSIYSKESLKKAIILGNLFNVFFALLFLVSLQWINITISMITLALIFYHFSMIVIIKYIFHTMNLYAIRN